MDRTNESRGSRITTSDGTANSVHQLVFVEHSLPEVFHQDDVGPGTVHLPE
jgi:hypothetical protein